MCEAVQPLEPAVVEALVANHKKFLRFLEKRLGDSAVAEEILQNAFVKTVEKGSELRDGEGAVTWFYRLIRNALIDHYRSHEAEQRALARKAREPVEDAIDVELKDAICACMHDLLPTIKPEYAEMVRRVDLEERSVSEIAKEEGLSANNAMVRLHRARQALKRSLERSCGTCATHGCLDCSCGAPAKP